MEVKTDDDRELDRLGLYGVRHLAKPFMRFKRPAPPTARRRQEQQTFQIVDSTYEVVPAVDAPHRMREAMVYLACVTDDGYSGVVCVRGFDPYFMTETTSGWFHALYRDKKRWEREGENVLERIRGKIQSTLRGRGMHVQTADPAASAGLADIRVRRIEVHEMMSMHGYREETVPFLKIVLTDPRDVPHVRDAIENERLLVPANYGGALKTYASNINYVNRFFIDTGIEASGYFSFETAKARARDSLPTYTPPGERFKQDPSDNGALSFAQFEYVVDVADITAHSSEKDPERYGKTSDGVRTLYYDIECAPMDDKAPDSKNPECNARVGAFPQSYRDPINSISIVLSGENGRYQKTVVLALGESDKVEGADFSRAYNTEGEMLVAYGCLKRIFGYNGWGGYNNIKFDGPYEFDRAYKNGLTDRGVADGTLGGFRFDEMGWLRRRYCEPKVKEFENKGRGRDDKPLIEAFGVVPRDVIEGVKKDFGLPMRSYRLTDVAAAALDRNTHGLTPKMLPLLAHGFGPDSLYTWADLDDGERKTIRKLCTRAEGSEDAPDEAAVWVPTPAGTAAAQAMCKLVGKEDPEQPTLWALEGLMNGVSNERLERTDMKTAWWIHQYNRPMASPDDETSLCAAAGERPKPTEGAWWDWMPRGRDHARRVTSLDVGKDLMTYEAIPIMHHGAWEDRFPADLDRTTWKLVFDYCRREVRRKRVAPGDGGRVRWQWTKAGRAAIHKYCLQDAMMAIKIDQARMYAGANRMLSCLTCATQTQLITGGVSGPIQYSIERFNKGSPFIQPYHRPADRVPGQGQKREKGYQGAFVLPMKTGLHTEFIIVLDFSGLYPSIMMRNNLCYTTWVRPEDVERLLAKGVAMHKAPNGEWFVDKSVRKGVLVSLLEMLTKARGTAKKSCASAKILAKGLRSFIRKLWNQHGDALLAAVDKAQFEDATKAMDALLKPLLAADKQLLNDFKEWFGKAEKVVELLRGHAFKTLTDIDNAIANAQGLASSFDARQLGIKCVANSVYGYTGADLGKFPCKEVASAVTAYGREMLMKVKEICETCNPDTGLYGCHPAAELPEPNEKGEYPWMFADPDRPKNNKSPVLRAEAEASVAEWHRGVSPYKIDVVYGGTLPAACDGSCACGSRCVGDFTP